MRTTEWIAIIALVVSAISVVVTFVYNRRMYAIASRSLQLEQVRLAAEKQDQEGRQSQRQQQELESIKPRLLIRAALPASSRLPQEMSAHLCNDGPGKAFKIQLIAEPATEVPDDVKPEELENIITSLTAKWNRNRSLAACDRELLASSGRNTDLTRYLKISARFVDAHGEEHYQENINEIS